VYFCGWTFITITIIGTAIRFILIRIHKFKLMKTNLLDN